MRRSQSTSLIAIAALLALGTTPSATSEEAKKTRKANGGAFISLFADAGAYKTWRVSDHEHITDWLRTAWKRSHTKFEDDVLKLSIARDGDEDDLLYTGGEVQQNGRWYGFGRYEVAMRPAKGSGIISSFFTHTDSFFKDPHDEIDIEFVGRDTRIVYVNSFADGKQWGPETIQLPFDAAKETHLYAFDWTPDKITWFVDGEEIYSVTSDEVAIPQTPQRLMMNIWSGGKRQWDWHGAPKFEDGAAAIYECVSFTPAGEDTPSCAQTWTPNS